MRLARRGYVDLCFVIAWRSRQNVSIEYMQCSLCPACQPGGGDGETGQRQLYNQPIEQRRACWLLRCLDRAGLD